MRKANIPHIKKRRVGFSGAQGLQQGESLIVFLCRNNLWYYLFEFLSVLDTKIFTQSSPAVINLGIGGMSRYIELSLVKLAWIHKDVRQAILQSFMSLTKRSTYEVFATCANTDPSQEYTNVVGYFNLLRTMKEWDTFRTMINQLPQDPKLNNSPPEVQSVMLYILRGETIAIIFSGVGIDRTHFYMPSSASVVSPDHICCPHRIFSLWNHLFSRDQKLLMFENEGYLELIIMMLHHTNPNIRFETAKSFQWFFDVLIFHGDLFYDQISPRDKVEELYKSVIIRFVKSGGLLRVVKLLRDEKVFKDDEMPYCLYEILCYCIDVFHKKLKQNLPSALQLKCWHLSMCAVLHNQTGSACMLNAVSVLYHFHKVLSDDALVPVIEKLIRALNQLYKRCFQWCHDSRRLLGTVLFKLVGRCFDKVSLKYFSSSEVPVLDSRIDIKCAKAHHYISGILQYRFINFGLVGLSLMVLMDDTMSGKPITAYACLTLCRLLDGVWEWVSKEKFRFKPDEEKESLTVFIDLVMKQLNPVLEKGAEHLCRMICWEKLDEKRNQIKHRLLELRTDTTLFRALPEDLPEVAGICGHGVQTASRKPESKGRC